MENERTESSSGLFTLLAGVGIGAALMYFFDPNRGNRRRHLVADKATRAGHVAARELHDVAENARNHAYGAVAEAKGRISDEPVSDDQLAARVRSELGRHVERMRAIEVVADGGTVTLRGTVSPAELPDVIARVEGVRGVNQVNNELNAGVPLA